MNKMKENWRRLIFFIVLMVFLGWLMDFDMKIVVSFWFVVIMTVIIYKFWFDTTKDDINNEEQKTSFLNEKFDHLVNSVVECEGFGSFWLKKRKKKKVKYKVTDIIINRPRKIKKDEWEVLIQMRDLSPNYPYGFYITTEFLETDTIKILNISDIELDKIMTNEKGFNGITNTIKKTIMGGLTILNPDVLKTDEN